MELARKNPGGFIRGFLSFHLSFFQLVVTQTEEEQEDKDNPDEVATKDASSHISPPSSTKI